MEEVQRKLLDQLLAKLGNRLVGSRLSPAEFDLAFGPDPVDDNDLAFAGWDPQPLSVS